MMLSLWNSFCERSSNSFDKMQIRRQVTADCQTKPTDLRPIHTERVYVRLRPSTHIDARVRTSTRATRVA